MNTKKKPKKQDPKGNNKTLLHTLLKFLHLIKSKEKVKIKAKGKKKKTRPKKPRAKISKTAKRPSDEKLRKELKAWKIKVSKLTTKMGLLEKQLKEKDINPKKAENTVNVVYSQLNEENKNIKSDFKYTQALMRRLEGEYFKRRLTESEFRQRMLDYREKLYLLKLKKKEVKKQKHSTDQLNQMIQHAIVIPQGIQGMGKGMSAAAVQPVQLVQSVQQGAQVQPIKVMPVGKIASAGKATTLKTVKEKPEDKKKDKTKFVEISAEQLHEQIPREPKTRIIHNIIEHKAKGKIDRKKLEQLESKVGTLSTKYNIPAEEIEKGLQGSDTKTLLKSFSRMISLLELEHKAKLAEKGIKEESTVKDLARYGISKEIKSEVKGVAVELKKHRIITDFDRILSLVHLEGRVKLGEISKKEKIERNRVLECAEVLETSGLVNIVYPTIGDPFIQLKDYVPQKKIKKKVKKNVR